MTGFARVQKTSADGDIVVSVKTVNHRGLDLHFYGSAEIDPIENAMRTAIKKAVIRGHVDVRVAFVRLLDNDTGLNENKLKQFLDAFRRAAQAHNLPDAEPDLNVALQMPGMFGGTVEEEPGNALEPFLMDALGEALDVLNQFRSREGRELAAVIRDHNDAIGMRCEEIEKIRARAMPAFQQRLAERLKEVLRNSLVDPQRLVQEAALLADRSDIGEEIARLRIHSKQVGEILALGGEVGKKIDFLLQEMNRETNTILSKTNGIGDLGLKITDLALACKADIEKVREQALNLE
jgi:uncharacterized protein (TIGR00255 family)